MAKKKKPKKWTEVYPVGTPTGDEECRFFKTLARHPKFQWRSVAAISKEANLTQKRTEEIITKYFKIGMIFQSPTNEEHWAYWERVPEMLPDKDVSISRTDQGKRIDKVIK